MVEGPQQQKARKEPECLSGKNHSTELQQTVFWERVLPLLCIHWNVSREV